MLINTLILINIYSSAQTPQFDYVLYSCKFTAGHKGINETIIL
ncbi:hypothetical protein MuYL_3980 [Mucilaginibacter xinganensis]|uniref:Uncharacterized protein n=1 Tax=Mucilaginibacter xinganensis TaxID=1234841 RepID=A0A223P171_9SPHI|nr:hypothetical protein MuYL_3980 [Mucilaginibacter xinganensis]